MPHKFAHGAWVFVGDGQKALFLINQRDEKFPNLRHLAVEEHKDPPSREQGSDAPGRAYSSVGEIRSAVGETDWHELEKERFAAAIADRINKVAQFVKGLHADHHHERETSNDDGGERRIHQREKIGPPASELQSAPQQRPRQAERSPVERRIEQCEQPEEQQ